MSSHLADDLVKSWSKDIAGTWTINPKPDEIWKKLSKYFEKFPDSAHPLCFKEYLIRGANAGELSYSADKAVDKMFDYMVAQNLQKEHRDDHDKEHHDDHQHHLTHQYVPEELVSQYFLKIVRCVEDHHHGVHA